MTVHISLTVKMGFPISAASPCMFPVVGPPHLEHWIQLPLDHGIAMCRFAERSSKGSRRLLWVLTFVDQSVSQSTGSLQSTIGPSRSRLSFLLIALGPNNTHHMLDKRLSQSELYTEIAKVDTSRSATNPTPSLTPHLRSPELMR